MGEKLFTPRSLARVAEAVEWEDELVFYKDGTSNQSEYMKALAILWERWMREWAIPDFLSAVQDVGSQQYVSGLVRIAESLENRLEQLGGFFRGLWAGANPKGKTWWLPTPTPLEAGTIDEQRALNALRAMFEHLQVLTTEIKEETYGRYGRDERAQRPVR